MHCIMPLNGWPLRQKNRSSYCDGLVERTSNPDSTSLILFIKLWSNRGSRKAGVYGLSDVHDVRVLRASDDRQTPVLRTRRSVPVRWRGSDQPA